MALFGKKLSALEELKKAYEKLSDEEKEAFKKSLTTEETTEVTEEISDEQADNRDEVIQGLTDRVNALEEALKGFEELKALMEEYNAKNAERFGYKGKSDTEKKSFQDMTTEELAERQKIKI